MIDYRTGREIKDRTIEAEKVSEGSDRSNLAEVYSFQVEDVEVHYAFSTEVGRRVIWSAFGRFYSSVFEWSGRVYSIDG